MPNALTPDVLLWAYRHGLFPMADPDAADELFWLAPDPRGVLPLDRFHTPHNLRRLVRRRPFTVRTDTAFERVVRACAAPAPGRESTWISGEVAAAYTELHRLGFAHTVECWREGELVGGLYGVAIGGAFFGESMFHRVRDASKVALVHLVRRLRRGGYVLLDVQFVTPHLARFGAEAIPRAAYERRLADALAIRARWDAAVDAEAS
ncbi:MAG: leucyl/phenylalanyl-tRNA--protein transferase [Rhodothermales bacterium]|nr:leucyl/phenylalanyl-tRNA--protein transferase [Rhodothermales bacterium]